MTNDLDIIFNNLSIDKSVILGNIDQEEAFSNLLGNQPISISTRALNIFREESDPSIRFMWTDDNRLYAKDFSNLEYSGDLVEWVKFYNRDIEKKIITNTQALEQIRKGIDVLDLDKRLDEYIHIASDKISSTIDIEAKIDDDGYAIYDDIDLDYWGQFGITKNNTHILSELGIFSCKRVWIKKSDFTETFTNYKGPIYAYYFEEGKYKIYQPYAKKEYKWRCNHILVDDFGMDKDSIVKGLSKSRKDRVVWRVLGKETYCFTAEIVPDELPYDTDFICYDNDFTKPDSKNTGILRGKATSQKFNIPNIYIDNKYECTDLAEVSQKYGINYARNVADNMLKSINII